MATTRKPVDWDALEPHYRAGVRPLKDLGEEFGCSDAAIVKHAKKHGWTRDLAGKIKAKADAKVSAAAVSAEVSAQKAANEQAVVEANAEVQFQVRMRHRADIKRLRDLFDNLLQELVAETADPDLFNELGEMLRSEDDKGQDKRNDLYHKVIGRSARVEDAKKLTDLFEKLVRMERQAFGIDDGSGDQAYEEMLQALGALR